MRKEHRHLLLDMPADVIDVTAFARFVSMLNAIVLNVPSNTLMLSAMLTSLLHSSKAMACSPFRILMRWSIEASGAFAAYIATIICCTYRSLPVEDHPQ